jgi:hypothetical protein
MRYPRGHVSEESRETYPQNDFGSVDCVRGYQCPRIETRVEKVPLPGQDEFPPVGESSFDQELDLDSFLLLGTFKRGIPEKKDFATSHGSWGGSGLCGIGDGSRWEERTRGSSNWLK